MSLYNEHIPTTFFPVLIPFLSYEPAKIRQNNMDHLVFNSKSYLVIVRNFQKIFSQKIFFFCKSYLDLSFHCDAEQCYKIHNQNWPKNRNIKEFKKCTAKCNHRCFSCWIPKFEFGQASNKRSKFVILFSWKF